MGKRISQTNRTIEVMMTRIEEMVERLKRQNIEWTDGKSNGPNVLRESASADFLYLITEAKKVEELEKEQIRLNKLLDDVTQIAFDCDIGGDPVASYLDDNRYKT